MATETAPHRAAATERHISAPTGDAGRTEPPPKPDAALDASNAKTSWSDVANQCNFGSLSELRACAGAVGDKLGQSFGSILGVQATDLAGKKLQREGILPDLRIHDAGTELRPGAHTEKSEWKSPFQRKYEVGDRFKGVSSVYWQDVSTASGIRFNKDEHTAASREFPFGTVLKVRNPTTGLETNVVITDNGPFRGAMKKRPGENASTHERVIDLADGAARAIGMGRTVKELEISVVSIPEGGAWGDHRRNLKKAGKEALLEQVRQVTEEGKRKR